MLKHLAATLGLAAMMIVPAYAAERTFEPNESGQTAFAMPSGNIGCLYTPAGGTDVYQPQDGGPELICERVEPEYVTVILTSEGPPEMIEEPGEQSCCGAENVLQYGDTVVLEGFVCASETSGLTCETADSAAADDDEADDSDEHGDTEDGEDDGDTEGGEDTDDSDDAEDADGDEADDTAEHGFTMARAGISLF